jgi:hypothetical protein
MSSDRSLLDRYMAKVFPGFRHDRKEDEFVRNFVVDRSETYQLNPVERAICRNWLQHEKSNMLYPAFGAAGLALALRPRTPNFSKFMLIGSLLWPSYVLYRGPVSRPAVEFQGNNPLFVDCINACQKQFPQGQVAHRSKWIHDTNFMKVSSAEVSLLEYSSKPSPPSPSDQSLSTRLTIKNIPSDIQFPHSFWFKLFSSSLMRQLNDANAEVDRLATLRYAEKMRSSNFDFKSHSTKSSAPTPAMRTPLKPLHVTESKPAAPEIVEIEEEHIPVSQWPNLHPDVNIEALERLAAARRKAVEDIKAARKAREALNTTESTDVEEMMRDLKRKAPFEPKMAQ